MSRKRAKGGQGLSMNNAGGHLAILAGAGVAAVLLASATYIGRRMETAASGNTTVVTVPARPAAPTQPAQTAPRQPSAPAAAPRDPTALARKLQSELKRVGCYDGEISGVWSPRTRAAMKAFTDRVNASLPVDKPDQILLALVENHKGFACPAPVLAKAPAKAEPPEADAAPKAVPVPAVLPPIAVAPRLLPAPAAPTPAVPQPTARVDPSVAPPQAAPSLTPAAPGERPPRAQRQAGPVPEVGVYERRPRRAARPYRQVRYARALIRSLRRAASTPWRLP